MTIKQIISLVLILLGIGLVLFAGFLFMRRSDPTFINPLAPSAPTPASLPLLRYSFRNLREQPPHPGQINIGTILEEEDDYTAYQFSFNTDDQYMTGQLNIPQEATPSSGFPVIVMVRGFVPPAIYETGIGTRNAAAYYAQNGFATLAPDFLGFGGSDDPLADPIGARVEKPRHVINLLASIRTLTLFDSERIGMWGHSNGGQIALSVLEITGKPIPTVLWAPVSKSFPYSILYYTDESEDQGKALRQVIAQFETDYDVFDYSIDRYFDWITAPIEVHQGTADDAVPVAWSNELVEQLKAQEIDVEYFVYPGADHNLRPNWDEVVAQNLAFFRIHILNEAP